MSNLMNFFGQNGFDPNSVEPTSDLLPPGQYPVEIEKAEVKPTKAGTGHYIWLQMRVMDGQFANRKVFDQLNIDNPSQQCVKWSLETLGALLLATGIPAFGDTDQLLGQRCVAHVKVKDDQNNVRTYSPLTQQQAPCQPQQSVYAPPQQSVYAPPQQSVYAPPQQSVYAPPQQAQLQQAQQQQAPVAGGAPPWAR